MSNLVKVSFKVSIEQRLSQDSHGGHRHSLLAYSPHQWLTYSQPVQSTVQEDSVLQRRNEIMSYVKLVETKQDTYMKCMIMCCYVKLVEWSEKAFMCLQV